jgi:hypothetical protein
LITFIGSVCFASDDSAFFAGFSDAWKEDSEALQFFDSNTYQQIDHHLRHYLHWLDSE